MSLIYSGGRLCMTFSASVTSISAGRQNDTELDLLAGRCAFTALYASKGNSWQSRDTYLAGTKRDPQIMTAAMQADRTSRRASIVLLGPVTCLSRPEPEDPDLLRC